MKTYSVVDMAILSK